MSGDYLDWAEKYRPSTLADVIGNDAAVKALLGWAKSYGPKEKAAILYGPPGVGKTSAAIALAHDLGWDYIELNASDQRTKDIINKVAGSAASAGTFEGASGRRLIILDEADSLHKREDKGGESAIISVVKSASQPVILIANDIYAWSKDTRSELQDLGIFIQFRSILSASIAKALKKICLAEGITCEPDALMKISEKTSDLRSAVNDLQAAAQGKKHVTAEDVVTGERDVPETIFKVMGYIFRGHDMKKARESMIELDESPDDAIGWVDENLPRCYDGEDLEAGFDVLSKADIYLGRVMRRQDYGMWRYAGFLMSCGVNRAKTRRYGGFVKYSPPTYWQKLGRARSVRSVRDSIAAKVGKYCHTSKAEARSAYLPLLMFLFNDKDEAVKLTALLKFEEEEIAFLLNTKKSSKKVAEIYKLSRDLIEKEVEHEIDVFAHFSRPEAKPMPEEEAAEEKVEVKKRKARRKTRDGGDIVEAEEQGICNGPVEEDKNFIEDVKPLAEPIPEEKIDVAREETGPKKQKTLFDF